MYSRKVDGNERSFGVSGKLWNGVLVMYDRETNSFWTQIDGRSIEGEETGKRLEHVPSVFTSFGSWLDAHPDTLVLLKPEDERGQTGSRYAGYYEDPERLFLPHLSEGLGDAIGPKEVVFGVRAGGDALAVSEALLERDGVVNTVVGGIPVALMRNGITGEVVGVRRTLDGEVLAFEPLEGFEPTERVSAGGKPVRVSGLEPLRVDRAFWYAWTRTVKGSRVLTPSAD